MKMFGNLSSTGLEESGDRLGGFHIFDTDYYPGVVKLAYAMKSTTSAAMSIVLTLALGSHEYRETFWVSNKDGKNWSPDKNDATKRNPLMGFTSIEDLCLLTTAEPLEAQDFEDKVVNIYDFDSKKDVPTNVPVLVGLIGKEIGVGLLRQIVDMQKKEGNEYVNTGETREENSIDKFFHAETGRTVAEFKAAIDPGVFKDAWIGKNKGQTRNRAKGGEGKTGLPGGKPANSPFGAGAQATQAAAAKPNIFNAAKSA